MYTIEKCPELKCWIVFEQKSPSLLWDVYKNKYKKNCKIWVNEHKKVKK